MRMLSAVALFAIAFVVGPAVADDTAKKDKALVGSFTRKAGDLDLKLDFKKDSVMVFNVTIGDLGCVMTSKYEKDKDGVYHCEVTSFEKKGDFPVTREKGYKFTFKLDVKEKAIVMSDLTGSEIDDDAKKAIEGEYEMAKGD
ncbi:MAG TPA: hypothetical protein VHR66_04990 [Gemmataceae bacterium]|jgi:hypothetical protein|nr:hypothetical protein [Gemmataceae bacterium]